MNPAIQTLVLRSILILNAPNHLQLMDAEIEQAWREFFSKRALLRTISFGHDAIKIDAEEKLEIKRNKDSAYLSASRDEKKIYLESCDFRISTEARPVIWSISL
ncbi:MAG: hypothetical protein R8P61_26700 [Bacteroidia bacterium]|nr:hypothetical protein [Bacteroidia bacterium]